MSSHPHPAAARRWRVTAAALTVTLVLVLAAGAWALWRPLSEREADRLTARATVEAVRTDPPAGGERLPDEVTARQLHEFGPAPTPAQGRRLAERAGSTQPAAAGPETLTDAADAMARLAVSTQDADVATAAASVAASWWAAEQSASGRAPRAGEDVTLMAPSHDETSSETPARAGTEGHGTVPGTAGSPWEPEEPAASCRQEVLAALTALDRAGYTADAAAARAEGGDGSDTPAADQVSDAVRSRLHEPAATALLACSPPPAAGWYRLPEGFEQDPARAVGAAEHEATDALVGAVASSSAEERAWILTALRETARTAQALDPQDPVPALPGMP